jgi:diguanylate cyclase (GGDEF)-like protein/hemerythrin-like metal-binding protein
MSKERTDAANREMILKDKLTGIWNRRKLEEVGQVELRRLVRHGTPVSLMLIDLDDFKRINDRFGHAAGDAVLRRVAEVCGQWLRETDVFGRWGGEEFMVVLPGTGVDESLRLAEDLRRAVHAVDAGIGRQISISIGVSLCLSGDDWRNWFERTDAALYRAKSAGKNCSFFEIPLERVAGALQIRWTEDMKVGIDEVDADHAALIAINNDLLRFMNDTYDKRLVYERLREVERRMTAHTEREERLIDRWMPGRLAAHAAEHRALGDRFRFLVERFEADTVPLEALAQFLVFEMCAQHINLYDREVFRDFPAVAAAGFRASAEAGPVDRLETV